MSWYEPSTWSKEGLVQWTYDTLDPIYGEGGVLEPITVIVDPERTVRDEYVQPIVDDIQEVLEDTYENIIQPTTDKAESYLKWGAALGIAYLLLK